MKYQFCMSKWSTETAGFGTPISLHGGQRALDTWIMRLSQQPPRPRSESKNLFEQSSSPQHPGCWVPKKLLVFVLMAYSQVGLNCLLPLVVSVSSSLTHLKVKKFRGETWLQVCCFSSRAWMHARLPFSSFLIVWSLKLEKVGTPTAGVNQDFFSFPPNVPWLSHISDVTTLNLPEVLSSQVN